MTSRFSPFARFLGWHGISIAVVLTILASSWPEAAANVVGALLGTGVFGLQMVVDVDKGKPELTKGRSIFMCFAAMVVAFLTMFLQGLIGIRGAEMLSTTWLVVGVLTVQYAWLPASYKPQAATTPAPASSSGQ